MRIKIVFFVLIVFMYAPHTFSQSKPFEGLVQFKTTLKLKPEGPEAIFKVLEYVKNDKFRIELFDSTNTLIGIKVITKELVFAMFPTYKYYRILPIDSASIAMSEEQSFNYDSLKIENNKKVLGYNCDLFEMKPYINVWGTKEVGGFVFDIPSLGIEAHSPIITLPEGYTLVEIQYFDGMGNMYMHSILEKIEKQNVLDSIFELNAEGYTNIGNED